MAETIDAGNYNYSEQSETNDAWVVDGSEDGRSKVETRLWPGSRTESSTSCGHSWEKLGRVTPHSLCVEQGIHLLLKR